MKPIYTNTHEPRPCTVWRKGEPRPALFHLFTTTSYVVPPSPLKGGHTGGQVSEPCAVVEYQDGTVDTVPSSSVRFLDTKHLMAQYDWGDEAEEPVEVDQCCTTCKYENELVTGPCCDCEYFNNRPSKWEARG